MDDNTKEVGTEICAMVKDLNVIPTEILITATLKWEKLTERGSTPGLTGKSTMESGIWDLNQDMEYGVASTTILTSASGMKARLMVMAYIPGKTEIVTKENGISV
jgi:hypothetical protein